jgi:hypothetical protein
MIKLKNCSFTHSLQGKHDLTRGGTSLGVGENLIVFYYLSTSEIYPDMRGDLWWG